MSERWKQTSERKREWPDTSLVDFIVILWLTAPRNWNVSNSVLIHLSARSFACFARSRAPLHCTHLFARTAHLLTPELVGQTNNFVQFSNCPKSLWTRKKPDSLYIFIMSDFLNLVPIAAHENWCYIQTQHAMNYHILCSHTVWSYSKIPVM